MNEQGARDASAVDRWNIWLIEEKENCFAKVTCWGNITVE